MTNSTDLMQLLTQWRRLSESERDDIVRNDWKSLAQHQAEKDHIRRQIAPFMPSGGAARVTAAGNECGFNSILLELIALETRNRDLLATKRERLQTEAQGLNQTARNLQSVRRAYGRTESPRWHSYS